MSTITTAPAEIMWMPAGTHIICATINGKPGRRRVVVEASIVPKLNADLAAKHAAAAAHQAARPVVLFDHKQGAAAAFPQRFRWEEGLGIMLELSDWSQAGRAAVEGGNYGYISPAFLIDRRSSRVLGLTEGVEICSLVNDPAFECIHPIMEAIAASRSHDAPEPEGVDVVGSAHCNKKHIPECPNVNGVSGGEAAGAHISKQAAEAKIRQLAESASKKAQGARTKEELREKMPDGKIGQLFSTEEVMLTPVSEKVAEAVKNATGIDVSGRSHAITEERMWHAYSDHSEDSKSNEYPDQKDLSWKDFEKLPDIFENYDAISVTKRSSGETSIFYAKSYGDIDYIVLQRVGRKKRNGQSTLNFVTEWVQKVGGRSRLALDAARDRSPSSPTTGSVADAEPDVKSYLREMLTFFEKEDEAKSAKKGKLLYIDKNRAEEWARLEGDKFSKLLTTTRADLGSGDIKAQHAGDVNGKNEPYAIFSALLAKASHCNQHKHAPGCSHGSGKEGGSSTPPADDADADDDAAYEAELAREEELERLEKLLIILDEEEESARDAESAGDDSMHHPERYREKWDSTARKGDPLTRDELEKRIAQLQDAAKSARADFSPHGELANPATPGENDTANANHNTTMNENIKKKLGLAPDASDEDVEAAITKLAADRDAHKKKAEEAAAACKQKDDELKAARAAEKEDWLTGLKKSGRIAPQDEEAINAASALYDANAAAARIAYSKLPAADDAPVIQAAAAGSAANTTNLTLAERLQADFNL